MTLVFGSLVVIGKVGQAGLWHLSRGSGAQVYNTVLRLVTQEITMKKALTDIVMYLAAKGGTFTHSVLPDFYVLGCLSETLAQSALSKFSVLGC